MLLGALPSARPPSQEGLLPSLIVTSCQAHTAIAAFWPCLKRKAVPLLDCTNGMYGTQDLRRTYAIAVHGDPALVAVDAHESLGAGGARGAVLLACGPLVARQALHVGTACEGGSAFGQRIMACNSTARER